MILDAVGKRVIVEVLEENETSASGLIRANTQGARCKGRLISVGTKAAEEEPKLVPNAIIYYYKQPTFKFGDKLIAEFSYEHIIGVVKE